MVGTQETTWELRVVVFTCRFFVILKLICHKDLDLVFECDSMLHFDWKRCSKVWNSALTHSLAWGLNLAKAREKQRRIIFQSGLKLTSFYSYLRCLLPVRTRCMLVSSASGAHSSIWISRLAIYTTTRLQTNPICTPSTHTAVSGLALTDSVQSNWYRISRTQTHTICETYKMKDTAEWSELHSLMERV